MRRMFVLGFLAVVMLPACKDAHQRAIDLTHTGDAALSKHDWNGALASFEQALVLWPELQSAYEGRARSFEKMGDIDKAIASLAACPHPGCADERRRLEGKKGRATDKPTSTDQPSVQRPAGVETKTGSPQALAAVAKMPIRSPSELTAYLDASRSAGAARDCAVFTAILRVEQLPTKQRAALKKPLGAAIAALAPADGAKDSFKVSGRKAMPLDSLASGAQSCEELENLYNQSAAAAAKIQAMVAQMGGDEGTEVKIDRTAFIYTALRVRFEQPMSKKDIADHDALLRSDKEANR